MEETVKKPLSEMSWADIQQLVKDLESKNNNALLWELAKCTPAEAAVRILAKLGRTTWEPESENHAYRELVDKALDAERETAPFRSLVFFKPELEKLTTLAAFEYLEHRGVLVAVDMQETQSRLRVWDLETGRLRETIPGPTVDDDLFEPLQLATSSDGNWALTVHIGGRLCLWSHESKVSSILSESTFTPMTASRPFALWLNGRFVICGVNGQIGLLDPTDEKIDQIEVSHFERPVTGVCGGPTQDTVFVLADEELIVEIRVGEHGSQRVVWSGTERASCIHFSSRASRLFVGTRKGEVLSVDPSSGSVTASAGDGSTDSVLAIVAMNGGAQIVVGHPDGFMFRNEQSLEPLIYVPRKQALPRSPKGNPMWVLSDAEHIVFQDYTGKLRGLAFRFALLSVVPVAKLTMACITGLEIARESTPGWVGFIQLFAGLVKDEKIKPQWKLAIEVHNGVGTSGEKTVSDDRVTKEVPPPTFSGTFGTLIDETED